MSRPSKAALARRESFVLKLAARLDEMHCAFCALPVGFETVHRKLASDAAETVAMFWPLRRTVWHAAHRRGFLILPLPRSDAHGLRNVWRHRAGERPLLDDECAWLGWREHGYIQNSLTSVINELSDLRLEWERQMPARAGRPFDEIIVRLFQLRRSLDRTHDWQCALGIAEDMNAAERDEGEARAAS